MSGWAEQSAQNREARAERRDERREEANQRRIERNRAVNQRAAERRAAGNQGEIAQRIAFDPAMPRNTPPVTPAANARRNQRLQNTMRELSEAPLNDPRLTDVRNNRHAPNNAAAPANPRTNAIQPAAERPEETVTRQAPQNTPAAPQTANATTLGWMLPLYMRGGIDAVNAEARRRGLRPIGSGGRYHTELARRVGATGQTDTNNTGTTVAETAANTGNTEAFPAEENKNINIENTEAAGNNEGTVIDDGIEIQPEMQGELLTGNETGEEPEESAGRENSIKRLTDRLREYFKNNPAFGRNARSLNRMNAVNSLFGSGRSVQGDIGETAEIFEGSRNQLQKQLDRENEYNDTVKREAAKLTALKESGVDIYEITRALERRENVADVLAQIPAEALANFVAFMQPEGGADLQKETARVQAYVDRYAAMQNAAIERDVWEQHGRGLAESRAEFERQRNAWDRIAAEGAESEALRRYGITIADLRGEVSRRNAFYDSLTAAHAQLESWNRFLGPLSQSMNDQEIINAGEVASRLTRLQGKAAADAAAMMAKAMGEANAHAAITGFLALVYAYENETNVLVQAQIRNLMQVGIFREIGEMIFGSGGLANRPRRR